MKRWLLSRVVIGLAMVLAWGIVEANSIQTAHGISSSDHFLSVAPNTRQAQVVDSIVLPMDSQVTVEFISTSTACTGVFGLWDPRNFPIYTNYLYHKGISFPIEENFIEGTQLVFYITTQEDICGSRTYFSTDPNHARVNRISDFIWRIYWEDYTDADFNDLVVEVRLGSTVMPFLELPFNYSEYNTFIRAVSDTEMLGTVNSYFDHHYPTYNRQADGRVVTFHGYDSQFDPPGYEFRLAYDGHDGIDFWVGEGPDTVLAAGYGTIRDLIPATPGSCPCKDSNTGEVHMISQRCLGNEVVIDHPNGYTTHYGHLARFSSNIREGQIVPTGTVLGTIGSTGCSSGDHIHFQVNNGGNIPVDPFGWMPFPDSTYAASDEPDPWEAFQQEQEPPADGTSHYLWIHPLSRTALNNPNAPTFVVTPVGSATVMFPAAAFDKPYRIVVWESLNSPELVGASLAPLSTFAVYAYDTNEQPIWTLFESLQIEFRPDTVIEMAIQTQDTLPEYRIYQWSDTTKQWELLDTAYDPQTGVVSASSLRLGRFAVARVVRRTYLPLIIRN